MPASAWWTSRCEPASPIEITPEAADPVRLGMPATVVLVAVTRAIRARIGFASWGEVGEELRECSGGVFVGEHRKVVRVNLYQA